MIGKILTRTGVHVSIVVGLGFLLRFILATSWAVDIDEAWAYAPAALSYLRGNWALNYGHPMVVKLLFAGSVVLFGAEGKAVTLFPWLPESIGALRLVSVVMGATTCLVIYCLVKEITGRHIVAIIPCILLAFDPISIGESSYGILDPTMTFFYMVSILFFYRYIKGRRNWNFYASAVLFGLSVASKYFAFMGIFIFIGILLWKRKLRAEWKSMAVFLWIVVIAFLVVQPYLWSSPLVNLSRSWMVNRNHLLGGQVVKPPGNPFLIPPVQFAERPWPSYGPNPVASKPDFYATLSEAAQSPWYYILYLQVMYSTPFQLLVYPFAICKMIRSILQRRTTDVIMIGVLLVSIPTLYFALQTVRLSQYTILSSTSFVILGSIAFVHLNSKSEKYFLVLLGFLHVSWTPIFLSTSGDHFTGWGFYLTPMTTILADLFHLLWTLGSNIL